MNIKAKHIVILVESTDKGKPAWWYVKCTNRILAEKLKGMCRLGNHDIISLKEYGEIISSGWGKSPPPEITKQINDQYN